MSESTEAARRAVNACRQPGSDRRETLGRREGNPGFGAGCTFEVGVVRATRLDVERITGARIVSRLQRSVKSIFSDDVEASREANRGGAE